MHRFHARHDRVVSSRIAIRFAACRTLCAMEDDRSSSRSNEERETEKKMLEIGGVLLSNTVTLLSDMLAKSTLAKTFASNISFDVQALPNGPNEITSLLAVVDDIGFDDRPLFSNKHSCVLPTARKLHF